MRPNPSPAGLDGRRHLTEFRDSSKQGKTCVVLDNDCAAELLDVAGFQDTIPPGLNETRWTPGPAVGKAAEETTIGSQDSARAQPRRGALAATISRVVEGPGQRVWSVGLDGSAGAALRVSAGGCLPPSLEG